jgi:hypothetical protein
MTLSAVGQFVVWIRGGSGSTAFFAASAAWFAWMVVARLAEKKD